MVDVLDCICVVGSVACQHHDFGDGMATWFISGASSGIGAELARQLAARGDDVAVAARRRERLEDLQAELADTPGEVTVHELDVTDHDAVEAVMRDADQTHRGIDVVVANAGIGSGGRIGSGHHDASAAVVATNLVGVMSQAEVALALMAPRGQGQIVLVSSVAASRGLPGTTAAYSATKAAVSRLGESLRTQLRGSGIAVTTVCPGYIVSEMTQGVPDFMKTDTISAVASMVAAIDRRSRVVYIPRWWRPVAAVLKVVPSSVVQRFV